VGSVEIQDLLFTSKGATPGAVFVEWNIKASSPGAAAMWGKSFLPSHMHPMHVLHGGTQGTQKADILASQIAMSALAALRARNSPPRSALLPRPGRTVGAMWAV
jgi:hypothetical protein